MSTQSLPAKPPKLDVERRHSEATPTLGLRVLDIALLGAFLALTFLLGAFPLKDTDFWWHLRTGDLIRQTHTIPSVDSYTFGAEGQPWIDLHWLYQVSISWLYERGGVPALTLAKCGITTLAVLLLVTARRKDWPVWVAVVAWLPALLVLGGRMYVRPETLTLLYLSIYLAVLTRVDRRPWLALGLPLVQVAWVNTQGLFVFGPILMGFSLIDALFRPGAFAAGRARWWWIMGGATALIGLACLVNPYFFRGALYPLELVKTMGNPIFSQTIAELTPVPEFIRRDGLVSLPMRIHLLTVLVGVLSFLLPLSWMIYDRLRQTPVESQTIVEPPAKREKAKSRKASRKKTPASPEEPRWRPDVFRVLLFVSFTWLSWQATRNSHQFAAVVGSVTAWNFAEWAAAVRRRTDKRRGIDGSTGIFPRVFAFVMLGLVFAWVGTGKFYEASREGRTIGLGEEPIWFPHEAVKFSREPGMPERFLTFHNGHAALYEYYFGPDRKVYTDARLEVIGPDLYEHYLNLQRNISENQGDWTRELDAMGRPSILVDLEGNFPIAARLLTHPNWRCVWFDPIAAVFVHDSYSKVVTAHEVDFLARHFHPEPKFEPMGTSAVLALTKGLGNVTGPVIGFSSPTKARPLMLLGSDYARRLREADPKSPTGWKQTGLLETLREPDHEPVARFRMAFDPIFDLSLVRATYALRHATEIGPDDFKTLLTLLELYRLRMMPEAELPILDRIIGLTAINELQRVKQQEAEALRSSLRSELGPTPALKWENLDELNRVANGLLATGRAETAADFLEDAEPTGTRTWAETDRIATLRLHLGEPEKARKLWQTAAAPPRPGLRESRVGYTYLAETDLTAARESFRAALALDPKQFDAYYGLSILEQDLGRAPEALAAARTAVELAPTDTARTTAQGIVAIVTPYAHSAIATEKP